MKRTLKIIAYLLGSLALLIGIGATVVQINGVPTYEVKAPNLKIVPVSPAKGPDSARVAEGKRLVGMTCAQCHRGEGGRLEGRLFARDGAIGRNIFSANLTQHPNSGIGAYTDGELAFLLRTGIKRTGEFAPPWMPRFNHLSDEDLNSIIAYLRSDHEDVQASPTAHPRFEPSFLYKALSNTVIKPLPYQGRPVTTPPAADQLAYGRYLVVGRYLCFGCHSAGFESNNDLEPEKSAGYLAGGNPIEDREFRIVRSANLTPDPETGLGQWTEAQFVEALRFGRRPDGRSLREPMIPYAAISEAEAQAIWAYLSTVPPIKNPVERNFGQ